MRAFCDGFLSVFWSFRADLQDLEPERAHKKNPVTPSEPTQRRPAIRKKTPKKYVEEPEEIEDEVSVGEDDVSQPGVENENDNDPVEEQVALRPKRIPKKPAHVAVSVANEFLEKHKGTPLSDLADKRLVQDDVELFAVDSQSKLRRN